MGTGVDPQCNRMFRKLASNTAGRDLVVGDLHGCKAALDRLLDHVRFDAGVDRVISVGDLVDRGPDSFGCLLLLDEPWFHAVRGNHEAMLLDFAWESLRGPVRPPFAKGHTFLDNGGEWILRFYDRRKEEWSPDLRRLLRLVAQLPLVITVGGPGQRFNVVHADFFAPGYPDGVLKDSDIAELAAIWRDFPVETHPALFPEFTSRFLWSRAVMGEQRRRHGASVLDGLSPTFCGHTIDPEIRTMLSHICLDTGAFLAHHKSREEHDFGLSLVDVAHATAYILSGPAGNARIRERPLPL